MMIYCVLEVVQDEAGGIPIAAFHSRANAEKFMAESPVRL